MEKHETLSLNYPVMWSTAHHSICDDYGTKTKPRGYKTYSMLNSTEHEISNAHKFKYIKKFSFFLAQISLECYFSCS